MTEQNSNVADLLKKAKNCKVASRGNMKIVRKGIAQYGS